MTKKNTTPNHDLDEGLDRYDLPPDFDPYVPSREDILTCLRDQTQAIPLEQLAQLLQLSAVAKDAVKCSAKSWRAKAAEQGQVEE